MSRLLLLLVGALCVALQSSLAQNPLALQHNRDIAGNDVLRDRGRLDEVSAILALHRIRHEDGRGILARPSRAAALATALPDPLSPAYAHAALYASQTGAIAGRLSGLTLPQYEGAYVMAWMEDSTRSDYASSYAKIEPDGSYLIESLPPAAYYVMAWAEGFEPLYHDNVTDFSDAATIEVGDVTVEGINFDMVPIMPGTGSISGVIRSDADGSAVAGADVYAFDPGQSGRYGYAVSADDGSYTIPALRSGRYVVQVYAAGFLPEFFDDTPTYETATRLDVEEQGKVTGIDFSLSEGGSISGIVRDEDGSPLAGGFVAATPPFVDSTGVGPDGQIGGADGFVTASYGSGFATTNEDGSYRIEGLVSGDYVVFAQVWSPWSYAFQWYDHAPSADDATVVPVTVGSETSGIDFDLALPLARSSIAGSVYDGDGDAIQDAFVLAELIADDQSNTGTYVSAYAFTDHAGRYVIEGVPAGSYSMSASAQIGWTYVQRWYPDAESPEDAEPVTVDELEALDGIDIVLPADGGSSAIAGMVADQNSRPLPNAVIEVTPAEEQADGTWFWAYATTDSSGEYRLDHLPNGSYLVHASYWSGESFGQSWYDGADDPESATPIHLTDDERTGIDFRLDVRPIYGSVAGTVTNESNTPLRRVYVELQAVARESALDAPFRYTSTYAVTDDDGRFTIERVPEGPYLLAVYGAGGFEYFEDASTAEVATPVVVDGGSVTEVQIALSMRDDGDGAIAGRVTEDYSLDDSSAGPPLPVAVVVAQPAPGPSGAADAARYVAVAETDGAYRIGGMAPGDYIVSTFAPGYAAEYYDDAYSPEQAVVVEVDGLHERSGIDFELWAVYYAFLGGEADAGIAALVIFGSVTDSNGAPVDGATVHVLNDSERPVASTMTGPDGRFEIAGLGPGTYRVYAGNVGAGGGYNGQARSFADASPITVSGGRVEVDIVVSAGAGTGSEDDGPLPHAVELLGNYPNPFNPETTILFRLGAFGNVRLVVYNLLGEEVAILFDGRLEPGSHSIHWNGRGLNGFDAASGSYFYRLETNSAVKVGKMLLIR